MRRSGIDLLFQGRNLLRLLEGLWMSASIALVAMGVSILLGTLLGVVMTSRRPVVRLITRTYLETMRIMPQIVLLFVVFFDLTRYFGINLDGWTAAVIVFTLWGTAEMGDLVRAAITSIPGHQYHSARALGLSPWQVQRSVILPQAVRRLLPTTINLTNRMIMTTPLVALIGVVEVLKTGQQIIDPNRFTHPDGALWIYGAILLLYFALCFPISRVARLLERRWS
ncbi:MAG: amino acid ABC transporter permease [Arachnia propionica]|uniref:amino acid ABC transporter permease n=1 Tax=Arachnia propionica TaxID=1750 RepID=UPI0027012B46|nr:amino acid ABC transporter permease [Arachnia propionica]